MADVSQVFWLKAFVVESLGAVNCGWLICWFLLKFLHLGFDTECRAPVNSLH